ncbi:MAG: hypothetical protein OXD46_08820 [Chloroflexi bacterium]|nr:hypothetical protein [Chloroflexota bacterium]
MKTGIRPIFAVGTLIALAIACGSQPEPTPTPWPTPDNSAMSRIAFATNRDGNWEIYVMNSDGSNPHNITNNPRTDSHPSWSPDGSKIAFQSERDGNWEIYVMNSDGSEQVRLTDDRGVDQSPVWSPDGTKIAFVSDRGGRHSVWTMNSERGQVSEDGEEEDPEYGLELVDVTGSYVNSRWPAWGPRSRTLAYETTQDVRIVRIDDVQLNEKIVDKNNFFDGFFVGWLDWSPDGNKLAMISNHQERTEFTRLLYTSQLDGFRFRRVYDNPSGLPYERPTWAPDSNMIVYSVKDAEDGDWDIQVVDFTTRETWRLTNDSGASADDTLPDWEPRGFVPEFRAFQ